MQGKVTAADSKCAPPYQKVGSHVCMAAGSHTVVIV